MEDIVNGFSSLEEENEKSIEENPDPLAINPADYEDLKIIQILQNQNLLSKDIVCVKCKKIMKKEKNYQYLDNSCWRCRSNNPSHDIKLNIRINSLF